MTTEPKRSRPRGGILREAVERAKVETEGLDAADIAAEAQNIERRDIRPQLREEDPRARAARRAAELRDHLGDLDEGHDDFAIPESIVPPGWSYEWKRKTVMGAEDPAYMQALLRKGWEPVPTARHPEFMVSGDKNPNIERKGMILMERPLEITIEARRIEERRARSEITGKEAQLKAADAGQFERNLAKVGKSYEAVEVPRE
jgi:hypothetical protein